MAINLVSVEGAKSKMSKHTKVPWYKKPILKSALYTDLQRGAWHIGFYTMVRIYIF